MKTTQELISEVLAARKRSKGDWKCQECGKQMSASSARRATFNGCTKCGSTDIDLA